MVDEHRPKQPLLSVIVIVYNINEEARRTLYSLSMKHQRYIGADDYEIIVVDNGSDPPFDSSIVDAMEGDFRLLRVESAPPSPAHAINIGLKAAQGNVIGVMIDGARIATPGLLHFALHGASLYEGAVVSTLGWYLGHDLQGYAVERGYDRKNEDELLASISWPDDGYRLFEIGTMDESSVDGWFMPIAESNALFAGRAIWDRVGGADERFDLPGGGLVNLDLYERMHAVAGVKPVILLGEATFHQYHGGINTNAVPQRQVENFRIWALQYESIRGNSWTLPDRGECTFLGTLTQPALRRMVRSAMIPAAREAIAPLGDNFLPDVWSNGLQPTAGPAHAEELVRLGLEKFRLGQFEACSAVARLLKEREPEERGLDNALSLVASCASISSIADSDRRGEYHVALGEAHEILGENDRATESFEAALRAMPDCPEAYLGLSRLRMPGMPYLWWLERFYTKLAPKSVVELGVFNGDSLALVQPPTIAIGVDPKARILSSVKTETHIFAETSDEFFARRRTAGILGSSAISIGFIDGMHTFEQALRDFIGLESLCDDQSIIVLHDTVPLDEATQTPTRQTAFWTGNVWKIVPCLKQYRPDLDIFTIATPPSGLTIIRNLDPASRKLQDRFGEIIDEFTNIQYSEIKPNIELVLNVIPNDWDIVEARLKRTTRVGSYSVVREQPPLLPDELETVKKFHELYYTRWIANVGDTVNISWFGYETLKCPMDLWIYQEILVRTRPDVVVETGTLRGGSALYFAMLMDQLGHGRVISIDIDEDSERPFHPRITYLQGSSTDPEIIERVYEIVDGTRAMLALDSDHTAKHVYEELLAYNRLVHPGDYLIVEDTNINGHPTSDAFGPGPMEATRRFLEENDEFAVDWNCERLLMTLNPGGYLRRSSSAPPRLLSDRTYEAAVGAFDTIRFLDETSAAVTSQGASIVAYGGWKIILQGWIALPDPLKPADAVFAILPKRNMKITSRIERPDFVGLSDTHVPERAGFYAEIDLDDFDDGSYELRIGAVQDNATWFLLEPSVDFEKKTAG